MTAEHRRQLQSQLWNIANTLRGKMNADEFRDYILGFIFYKYLSEKLVAYANELLAPDGITYDSINASTDEGQQYITALKKSIVSHLGYFLAPSDLFSKVAERGNSGAGDNFILSDLGRIFQSIEQSTLGTESEDDFNNLFQDVDLTSAKLGRSENDKNELISKVLAHLDVIDFLLEDMEADVLGDAYEYLIGQFASGAGKKAGEFYTPQEVSTILSRIVTMGKSKLRNVYDPACGSGSLLLRVAREVDSVGDFYGQELNNTTYNLCRMNMIMHGVHYRNFDIKQEDTLERPQHIEQQFEAVVANPPFSAKWSASDIHTTDDRFSQYGRLAPKSKADYAFICHMLHQLADNGTMAVVMPHGVLFRGAAEGHIRQYLIKDVNYLDAVIGLPPNIFYGTGIPTCIMIFKKCRENPDDVLFIDASAHYEKVKTQNILRSEDINRIVDAYRNRKPIDKLSYVATMDVIAENDYNLNIPRYVDTFEEEEPIDINAVAEQLQELDHELTGVNAKLLDFCKELNIKMPF